MRLRRQYKIGEDTVESDADKGILNKNSNNVNVKNTGSKEKQELKSLYKFRPMQIIKNMISTPDLGIQIVLILLTLTSENMRMDKRIDNMSVYIDKIRNVNEVINNSIQSLKVITELPKNVRHIMK